MIRAHYMEPAVLPILKTEIRTEIDIDVGMAWHVFMHTYTNRIIV